MVEVSEAGLIKEEEIELDLGLSIGGSSFRKPENSKESKTASLGSIMLSPEPESGLLDLQTKREIQALRRQEAKRKREEKRSRGRNESQTEEQQQQPAVKKERIETANLNANVNLNFGNNGQKEPWYPLQQGQHPYPPVQFVPYTNGFAYPGVMPCWTPAGGGGFRPFQPHKNSGNNNGSGKEQNGGGLVKTASFKESPMCSHSTVSSHQSAGSDQGGGSGGSSESRSHSSSNNGSMMPKETKSHSQDHKATSNPVESDSRSDGQKLAQPKSENTEPISIPKPISPQHEDSPPPMKEGTKMDPVVGEPPKPQTQVSGHGGLPQMPYVSTTGNGPNGRTIHGFLYRYTKSEISIVCVCHGSTFSPAEFVRHAGGTDVSQPLRHITVIPSAFG